MINFEIWLQLSLMITLSFAPFLILYVMGVWFVRACVWVSRKVDPIKRKDETNGGLNDE